jgi:eukaryotic-like serine/threonine-protein kinase
MARGDKQNIGEEPPTSPTARRGAAQWTSGPKPPSHPEPQAKEPSAAPPIPASTPARPGRAQVGQIIAQRYLVTGVLGEGGMGIVYRCRDRNGGAEVALKRVIPPEGRLADDYVTWFYKEARALASLGHPNIVDARDFGQLEDGSPYLAMELVKGLSLHDYSNARLSFPIIWSLVDQILSALAHAHSRRVIHGDLKPSNIIIEEGQGGPPIVHILDFGLAWLKEDPHDERLDGEKAMEFEPHAGAGTPGYMAPEQVMHEMHHVCGATDLYSLACILYKLLSGRAPFTGDPKELLKAHAYEEPPPLRPAVRIPEGVQKFVMRCMKKRPWERHEFAAEARRAWAAFKPPDDTDPRLWRFPRVAASPGKPDTSLTDVTTPRLEVDENERPSPPQLGERTHGLLSIRPTPMVGRDEIRDHLLKVCHEVIEGHGAPHRLIIMVGPAGVGKSRIAEWLAATVHEEGKMVPLTVRYRRIRGSSDGMLGAVTQYFNFERADRTTIERSLLSRWNAGQDQKMRTWVAGAAEWLRPHPPGTDTPGPSGVRFTLDTLDIRRQVIRFTLRRISGGRPLLFFLDDLHNAAQTTLEGLLRIHATESDQRILMVATVRAEDVQLGTSTAERLRKLREKMDGEVIEINPMDRETTCQLLQAAMPLDDAAAVEAARRSRGFPLFALQQLHAWAHAGDFHFDAGCYHVPPEVLAVRPKTTADLWESRLATLAPQHQQAAYAVSTLGLDIRRIVLKAMLRELQLDADEVIVSLQNAEIILPRGPGRYNWAHALLQEHLFRSLSERTDGKRLFLAAAQALRSHPLANTRRVVRQRCVNLLYAQEPEAAAQGFFDFLNLSWSGSRQPLATLADLDLFHGHLQGRAQGTALRWRAEASRQVGKTEDATRYATQAIALLKLANEAVELAHCERLLGGLKSDQGESEAGLNLVQSALGTFQQAKNIPGMAQCEFAIGQIELQLGRYDSARAYARLGDAHFASIHDPLGRGHCLLLLGAIERADGAVERARLLTIEARTEFERSGDQLGQAETSLALALFEHRLSNFFSADRGALDASQLFESLKIVRGHAACERLLAMTAIDTDNLEKGLNHARRAEQLYTEMRDPFGVVECRLLRAQASLARRDFPEARRAIMQAREISLREPEPRQHYLLTRAWFQLENGDAESAQEALNAAPTVFEKPWQVGEHTLHVLARLARLPWPSQETVEDIHEWRRVIQDHARATPSIAPPSRA